MKVSDDPAPLPGDMGAEGGKCRRGAHAEILKASAMIGGASLVSVVMGIIRTKVMAVLLGPAGFGLMSLYGAILELVSNVATMGTGSSGVRQIAEAASTGEIVRVARTARVLRRLAVVLGVLGGGALFLAAEPVSALTFNSTEHAESIAVLALAVFFMCFSAGQAALIQGMRRIRELARMGVLGSIVGTAFSIAVVYILGEPGVTVALVGIAAVGALAAWWYARRIPLTAYPPDAGQARQDLTDLLRLGFAFMASALLMSGSAYAVRLLLTHTGGPTDAGLYQAAWTLGGLYVGFILQVMGADFYPRLTGVANDAPACNRMVNEQAQVSLLLAAPGVIATLTFAQLVVAAFYTREFAPAATILQWVCMGMALRVVIWPVGYIILAKGAQAAFLVTELAWVAMHIGLAWLWVPSFHGSGAGMAFFGAYVGHGVLIFAVARRLTGFRWSPENRKLVTRFGVSIAAVFGAFAALPFWLATAIGVVVFARSGLESVGSLVNLIPPDQVPHRIRPLIGWLRSDAAGRVRNVFVRS